VVTVFDKDLGAPSYLIVDKFGATLWIAYGPTDPELVRQRVKELKKIHKKKLYIFSLTV
jgi:carbamoylphosphate synthase small subunit